MKALIDQEKLKFFLEKRRNVLLVGQHGVGKTAVVKQVFEAFGYVGSKARYFSGATLDPWVDFIGVPRAVPDPISGELVLNLIRPAEFANDLVEAIFVDEYNRTPKKVRNAIMELMQFKTINGRPFKNLKVVWAAINPSDEEKYDVEDIDPAQQDRFHIVLEIPYQPCPVFFHERYPELAASALAWWDELPSEQKELVSPRRLDYALAMFKDDGDMRDILPHSTGVSKLISSFKEGPVKVRLEGFVKRWDEAEVKKFLNNENNYASAVTYIVKNDIWRKKFLPCVPLEKLSALMSTDDSVLATVVTDLEIVPDYFELIGQKFKIGDKKLEDKIVQLINSNHYSKRDRLLRQLRGAPETNNGWLEELQATETAKDRIELFEDFRKWLPAKPDFEQAALGMTFVMLVAEFSTLATLNRIKEYIPTLNQLATDFPRVLGISIPELMTTEESMPEVLKKIKGDPKMFAQLLPELQKAI